MVDFNPLDHTISSMKKVTDIVDQNKLSLWIWPEGTRSRNGRLTEFKKGFVHLALDTKLPIVPIISHRAHKRWPAAVQTKVSSWFSLDFAVFFPYFRIFFPVRSYFSRNLDSYFVNIWSILLQYFVTLEIY